MKKFLASASVVAFPALALAQTTRALDAFSLLRILQNIVDAAIPFVIGLGILAFVYGVFNFVTAAGDEEARATAKQFILWGVIGIFVMVSVWGLVHIFAGTFNLSNSGEVPPATYGIPPGRN